MLVRTNRLALPTLLLFAGASSAMAQSVQVVTPTVVPAQSTVLIAPSAPPPPRVETMPAPGPEQGRVVYWQPGHWVWDGANWNWQQGQYVERPSPQAVWEPGRWIQQPSGGYVWVDGHWAG